MAVKYTDGFTLIEIMIAIAIIGLVLALLIPQLQQERPGQARDALVNKLQALVALAWQQALVSHKVHKVIFNVNTRTAYIERQEVKDGQSTFVKLKTELSTIQWPKDIEIKQFIINDSDQLSRFGPSRQVVDVYFYVMPDATMQPVTIHLIDKTGHKRKPQPFTLQLNPFSGQLKVDYA